MVRVHFIRQCIFFLALLFPFEVYAGIYVFVDENGVKHFTNTPTNRRYRPAKLPRLNTPPPDGYYEINRPVKTAYDPYRYDTQIKRAAQQFELDPMLIKAIIKAESDFDQNAISSKGAQGLMQLMPETASDMRVWNPYDPAENINGGARYLKKLLTSYEGDLARSLAAYNAGPSRVKKDGPLPLIKETRNYVQKVTRYYQQYKDAGALSSGRLTYN